MKIRISPILLINICLVFLITSCVSKSNEVEIESIPEFNQIDIGVITKKGKVIEYDDHFELIAGGIDIWGEHDSFCFNYKKLQGNFDFTVQILNFREANLYSKAGIMARSNLNDNSQHVFFHVFSDNRPRNNNNGGCEFQYRSENGNDMKAVYPNIAAGNEKFNVFYPNTWIRLKRVQNVFESFISNDNKNWHLYSSIELEMPDQLFVGLGLTAHHEKKVAKLILGKPQILN